MGKVLGVKLKHRKVVLFGHVLPIIGAFMDVEGKSLPM